MKQCSNVEHRREPRLEAYVALIIGIVIKTVFIVIAWSMVTSETIFSPFNRFSFIYFTLTLFLGSLLSGLVVGFLTREPGRGALLSFSGAILATILVLTSLSIRILFPAGIVLVIQSLTLDVMALVGGAIGASIKAKSIRLAVIALLAISILIPVHAFISGPIAHVGDLVIEGDRMFTIEDCTYVQNGDIIVKDNATLIVKNAELIIDQRQEEHPITVKNMAYMVVEHSRFRVITRNRVQRARATSWIYVEDSATLLLNESSALAITIITRQAGSITIIDSKWSYPITAYNQSEINAIDSSLYTLDSYDSSNVRTTNSSLTSIRCYDHSEIVIKNTNRIADTIRTYGYIHCHNHSYVEITDSTIDGLLAHAFQNTVCFNSTKLDKKIYIDSLSNLYIYGNVTINGQIEEFKGRLVRNYLVLTNPDTLLNVTNRETGNVLWKGKSNNIGSACFNVTFTSQNFTHSLQLNNIKDFNITSQTPLKTN